MLLPLPLQKPQFTVKIKLNTRKIKVMSKNGDFEFVEHSIDLNYTLYKIKVKTTFVEHGKQSTL